MNRPSCLVLAIPHHCPSAVLLLFFLIDESERLRERVRQRERQRERQRDRKRERYIYISLPFHPFMHSKVDSCMCPDQGLNLQPWWMGQHFNQLSYLARALVIFLTYDFGFNHPSCQLKIFNS